MPTPAFSITVTAHNYAKIRDAIAKMANPTWYRGIVRDTAHEVLTRWTEHAKSITHKLTGLLASSHVWEYDSHRSTGRVYISPRFVRAQGNTLQWAKVYGPIEHARGGTHAFYGRTLEAKGHLAEDVGLRYMIVGIPRV